MATPKKSANAEPTIVGRQELTKHIATQAQLTQKKAGEVLMPQPVSFRSSPWAP